MIGKNNNGFMKLYVIVFESSRKIYEDLIYYGNYERFHNHNANHNDFACGLIIEQL